MKNIFITLALLAATVAGAQTNSVKGSAEPSASALTGTENVLVIQGGATKLSSVAAINAAPLNAVAATNAVLSALITANAATITTASNALQTQITANVAANSSTSNTLQALITANTTRDTATSNSISATVTANATTAAAANLATYNAIQGIANAAAAQAAQTGVTNGGSGTFANVFYATSDLGKADASTAFTVNLAAGSLQLINFTNHSSSYLFLTNVASGQNVTLMIKNTGGANYGSYYPPNVIQISSGGNYLVIPSAKWGAFNFTVVGTNVICSASPQQN